MTGEGRGRAGIAAAAAGALALLAGGAAGRAEAAVITNAARLEAAVFDEVNDVRRRHGLPPLRPSRQLAAVANRHSRTMARRGVFTHGTRFLHRVERVYRASGCRYWAVAENLYWSPSRPPAPAVVQGWLDSPHHRAILVAGRFRELGLSAIRVRRAPGTFGGRSVTIVTAEFGVRRR